MIKLRAWDRINKKWLDLWNIKFARDGSIIAVHDLDGEIYGLHQVILQQFIGLKDRNGQEIFEGDIIWGMVTGNHPAIVECDASDGGYNIRERDGTYIEIDSNTRIEVIGNIYETPELLREREQLRG